MEVITNFKQMYLVDTMLYNKLTFKGDRAWIKQIPMNPNIHIHNKPSPPAPHYPPEPPSAPPAHPQPYALPAHPQPYAPPASEAATSSNTTSTGLPAPSHAIAKIQPSVEFLNQIYDSDDSDVKYLNYSDYNTVADSNIDKQKLDDLEKKEHAWIKNVQSRINPINNNLGITSPETMGYNQLQPLNFNSPMHIEYQQPVPAPAPTSARAPAPISARAPAPTFASAVVPTLAHAPAHASSHALSLLHVPAPAPALAQTHVHNQLDYNNQSCVECNKLKITFNYTLCDTENHHL